MVMTLIMHLVKWSQSICCSHNIFLFLYLQIIKLTSARMGCLLIKPIPIILIFLYVYNWTFFCSHLCLAG